MSGSKLDSVLKHIKRQLLPHLPPNFKSAVTSLIVREMSITYSDQLTHDNRIREYMGSQEPNTRA